MNRVDDAIDRIKKLVCPTGEIENSVALILEDYGVADKSEVNIDRDKTLDRDNAQAYKVEIAGGNQSIVLLAKSGYDDYVAKVIDAYSK